MGRGGGRGTRHLKFHPRAGESTKGYKSTISEIAMDTFNTGQNKFAAQFTQSRKNVANYLQRTSASEGYLVAETVRTGKHQTIELPPAIDPDASDAEDQKIIRGEEVKTIAKRRLKLAESLKKGYATVYDQCSQEVKDKLEGADDWESTQKDQLLHELINKIERICVGFDDHKQEVFNLVQALKTLFLYSQNDKETVEQYGRNFRALWETVEAFGGSPGVHQGMIDGMLKDPTRVANVTRPTAAERTKAEEDASEAVKAALLISGADRTRYGRLKDELANNYLLGTDQYPDTFEKAMRILGNYQITRLNRPYRGHGDDTGLAFIQRGGKGRGRGGRGGGAGRGTAGSEGADTSAGDASTVTTGSGDQAGGTGAKRVNRAGDSHCYNCGKTDHWAYECPDLSAEQQAQLHMHIEAEGEEPEEQQEGHQLLNVSMVQGEALPDNRAYLDGCSTVTAFKTHRYLKGIKSVRNGIKINCNAGAVTTNEVGSYGQMKVWYIPNGIANIFSMHELEKHYRITYDSWEGFYQVHTPRGTVKFHKDEQGLPYIDLDKSSKEAVTMLMQLGQHASTDQTEGNAEHTMLVETVRENFEGFTKNEVLKAKQARRAQAMMGNPSEKDFKGVVSNHLISNCPITVHDITNSRAIHGPALASVRGKTVRRAPAPVVMDYVDVPRSLVERHRLVTLAADVFFVDGTAFLMTISRRIKFITSEYVPVRTAKNLAKHIDRVVNVYARAGFRVRTILMDGEFEKIKDLVPRLECNTTAAKEHVSEAERGIRTIKERARGLIATLPFEHIPQRMKIEFIYFCVLWLNAFPVRNGISSKHSPRELMVRWKLDYKRHCRVQPGTYCEVHDEPIPSNTMTPRTHAAIALGPTGNMQGSVKFYCLTTGRVLKRRSFTPLPMPDRVVKRVNTIGQREKQGRSFRFLNRRKEPYEWTDTVPEDDPDFQGLLEEPEAAPYPDLGSELPGVTLEDEDMAQAVVSDEPEPDFAELAAAALDNAGINANERLQAAAQRASVVAAGPAPIEADNNEIVYEITFDMPDDGLIPDGMVPDDAAVPMNDNIHELAHETVDILTDANETTRRYPTRERRGVARYTPQTTFLQLGEVRAHRSVMDALKLAGATKEERMHATTWTGTTMIQDDTDHVIDKELVTESEDEFKVWAYVMTQYNLKPGLRKFGTRGATAAVEELTQLHIMDTWTAMDPAKISREESMKALSSLLFLKEKRSGKIKGRACINGAPQRAYIPKEEAASPTVSTESTFITASIAAHEHRKVRCYDIPSAFVNTEVDEDVIMVLKGDLADMMVQIAPQIYRKYVTVDKKGTPILYVKLQKALYGLMRASLLFYRKLRQELEDYGFEVNPYDPCVANKMTEGGKQLTLVWHVDDLMGSCEDNFELTKLSCYLARYMGQN